MAQGKPPSSTEIYQFLMESQHWPPGQMLDYQRSQLEQLLRHAKAQVPFYETRLDVLFDSHGNIDWSRWDQVPILKRTDVATHYDALQAKALPPGHGKTLTASTSGSTGLPISITHSRLMSDVCRAADWRAHAWWGLDWSKTQVIWHKYNGKYARYGALHDYGPWGPNNEARPSSKSFVADLETSLEERLAHLEKVGASYLFGQGNFPLAASIEMAKRGRHLPLDAVVSHGVQVDEQFHFAMKESFGARFFAMYSSKEGGRMAHMCPMSHRYHVNAECVLLEILDESGKPCPPGQAGHVIVTTIFNSAQPFIRYEQGDVATWAASCSCGTRLPVIERLDGRVYHMFRSPDGTMVPPVIPDDYREVLGAEFWQFVQTEPAKILVRYKPSTSRDSVRELEFSDVVRQFLKYDFSVEYEMISEIPLTPTGKFLKYVNATQS